MAITRHYADHPEKGIYYHLEGIPSQVAGEAGADALRFEVGGRSGKWSARNGGFAVPPPVGTWAQVMFNDLGWGTVIGYFVEDGWLGVEVLPEGRPDWHRAQNGDRSPTCLVFGAEIAPAAEPVNIGFGLPVHADAAEGWSARAILANGGYSLLPDRQGVKVMQGGDILSKKFQAFLKRTVAPWLRKQAKGLSPSSMERRGNIWRTDDGLVFAAVTPNASFGYLYIAVSRHARSAQ